LFVEWGYKEGKVILFTSTIDGEWNAGIVGRPPYLPIMQSAMEHLSSRPLARRNLLVGEPLIHVMTVDKYVDRFVLEAPTEGLITISPTAPKADDKFIRVSYPMSRSTDRKPDENRPIDNEGLHFAGKYVLRRGDAKEDDKPVSYFACNVPPRSVSPEELIHAEGNLERIDKDELMRRYPDFKFELMGEKNTSGGIDLQKDPSHLWKYLIYLLAGTLVIEAILAWFFGKAKQ
jgi:hypothetical protein